MDPAEVLKPAIDFAHEALPDLHEVLKELRAHGPVVRVKYLGAPVWLILGHAELKRAFEDDDAFDPSEGYFEMGEKPLGRNIMAMTGEAHRVNRAIVTAPFAPGKVRGYIEPLLEPVAHEVLDRLGAAREVDLVQAFTRPYPFTVITRLLGIPVRDEALFLEWAAKLFDFPWDPDGALRARRGFDDYMTEIVRARRRRPGDDFISSLAEAEYEGRRLDDEQILTFLRLLFPAGSDTTYKNAGSLFAAVLADPQVRDLARRGDAERSAIVAESLRWQPPTALLPRKAMGDAELGGVQIRKGDWTLFGITAANSDPEVFPEPRRFDPTRNTREALTFGRGPHFCLGKHLAIRELEMALKVVMERYPDIRLRPGRPVEFVSAVLRGPRDLLVQLQGPA